MSSICFCIMTLILFLCATTAIVEAKQRVSSKTVAAEAVGLAESGADGELYASTEYGEDAE